MISIILPSRNEMFLSHTIKDLLLKAKGEIEIIAVLDGYYPPAEEIIDDNRVVYLHKGTAEGLRAGINSAVAIAKGEYIMKLDAHCMVDEGFDIKLAADCEDNWVVVPTRHRLDAKNWCIDNGRKDPINYLYVECPDNSRSKDLGGQVWSSKNADRALDETKIDDLMTFQGSCWFMKKSYFYDVLGEMDEKNYGTFRKEPQEISFKVWLSGGRVVRNKNTWYAHLHKGKEYGRGYYASKKDWIQGDDYNKKWLTQKMFDKQIYDFKWMVDKFKTPGWENFKWTKSDDPKETTEEDTNISEKEDKIEQPKSKLYQNLNIDGEKFNNHGKDREGSKFWNEGKFENFIQPHLPKDCSDMTFVEMGTNCGLFLKMAKDLGFRNAAGFEKDRTPVEEGKRYRDLLGYDYKLMQRQLGGQFGDRGNFNFNEVPVADYTVLSTFHYYIDINTWMKYLDQLKNKTRYVVVVSRHTKDRHWRALSDLEPVRKYFSDWEEVSYVEPISKEGDPKPRNLWSVCFKSNLERVSVDDIKTEKPDEMYNAVQALVEEVRTKNKVDPYKTAYYDAWVKRKKGKWNDKFIKKFVKNKTDLLLNIKENYITDPLIVQEDLKLSDGGHRLAILKGLGYKNVIVRKV